MTVLREDWKPRPLAATKAMGPGARGARPEFPALPPLDKVEVSIQLGGAESARISES